MIPLVFSYGYRPEIDGLRAIAVLAVVLFHAGLGVPGGYIGVDVFFVISGFLITSLIVKDLESGGFTLAHFWERRARRIIPAMMVVVLATLAAGWFLLLPSDYANLGRSAAWQSVFGANIHYYLNTSYFTGAAEEKPLLHTWSLAVEEQFYMVVPLLLLVLFRFSRFRRPGILLLLFAAGITISLVASIYGVSHHPAFAFYLLPTRGWELLCGAFVALTPAAWSLRSHPWRECLCGLGLVGILIPCWLYNKTTPFPGLAAVPPCFGTALFIWASTTSPHPNSKCSLVIARFLSARPLVFVGLISYSLYLWHWPLFAFGTYWALEPLSIGYRLGIVVASFLFAVLSWRFVESPFRKKRLCTSQSAMLIFGVAGMIFVLALGGVIVWGRGYPSRLPAKALEFESAKEDKAGIHELTAEIVRSGRLVPIGNPDLHMPISVLLWGDSHAMAAAPAFDQFLREAGLAGQQATASATAPVLDAYWRSEFTNEKEVRAFNKAVFDHIQQRGIPNVVLAGYWEFYTDERGSVPLDAALLSTINRLVDAGVRPYILLQVPHPLIVAPKALAMASIFDYDLDPFLAKPTGWNGLYGEGNSLLKRIETAGGRILDPRSSFFDNQKQCFVVERNGVSIYRDSHHLSATGARMMLIPLLREALILSDNQK